MRNTVYSIFDLSGLLRHFRINSYNPEVRTQAELAKRLGRRQKDISNIENGLETPRLELIAQWCRVTGWYEGWEAIAHMYQLEPTSVPPIHPELSQNFGNAILNMRKQIRRALEALDRLEEVYNSRRPTRKIEIDSLLKLEAKEIFDLIPATRTILYSAERDIGLNIDEITQSWTQLCVADDLIMPCFSRMRELEMAQ